MKFSKASGPDANSEEKIFGTISFQINLESKSVTFTASFSSTTKVDDSNDQKESVSETIPLGKMVQCYKRDCIGGHKLVISFNLESKVS